MALMRQRWYACWSVATPCASPIVFVRPCRRARPMRVVVSGLKTAAIRRRRVCCARWRPHHPSTRAPSPSAMPTARRTSNKPCIRPASRPSRRPAS